MPTLRVRDHAGGPADECHIVVDGVVVETGVGDEMESILDAIAHMSSSAKSSLSWTAAGQNLPSRSNSSGSANSLPTQSSKIKSESRIGGRVSTTRPLTAKRAIMIKYEQSDDGSLLVMMAVNPDSNKIENGLSHACCGT